MPYYPEDQSQENLNKLRWNNVCSVCGRRLYVYHDFKTKQKYIGCPTPGHEGIAREYEKPREDYQSNLRREYKLEQEHGVKGTRALATIPKQGQLTQPQAMHILKLVYPKAPENEIVRTAIFCRDFGLHPLANEVYLIQFKDKWVMVVGIPANRKMAHALKGEFSFLDDTPRAATKEEITKQFGEDSEEAKLNTISVTKLQGEGGNFAIGFGLWPKESKPYGMDKGNTQRNMANIRSERQAMDRLPGKPMPRVEVIDEAYAEIPNVGKVNKKTGEIEDEPQPEGTEEGDFTEVPPDAEPEAKAETPEPEPGPTGPAEKDEPPTTKSVIDLDWLKESIKVLQAKGIKAYSDESMLGYMRSIYKKIEGDTIYEIASKLDKGMAKHFTNVIQDALDKA